MTIRNQRLSVFRGDRIVLTGTSNNPDASAGVLNPPHE